MKIRKSPLQRRTDELERIFRQMSDRSELNFLLKRTDHYPRRRMLRIAVSILSQMEGRWTNTPVTETERKETRILLNRMRRTLDHVDRKLAEALIVRKPT